MMKMNIKWCFKLVSESAGANSNTISLMVLLLLTTTLCSIGAQITNPIEVKALLAVKQNLKGPGNFLKKWNNQTDPCTSNWTGVLCFNTFSPVDGYLHVRELQLMRMNLTGTLSPELGRFPYMEIMDFMWNNITGSIPKEIGNVKSLKLLLLNGNRLTGSLPEELGDLSNLDRIQIDENFISGPLPKSFANLTKTKHFHMNNNSISGSIPPELSRLTSLVHFLLDNNNLSGPLPPELSKLPNLTIIQLDNNHFDGGIPDSYSNMAKLLKMSLRNCSLTGPVPDMSRIPNLAYISNQLNGSIPSSRLSGNMTTIDLSNNRLEGNIPDSFSGLPRLQKLSLGNNFLNGTLSSIIWSNRTFNATEKLILDFQNNSLSDISSIISPPENVNIRLRGNPVCMSANQLINTVDFCGSPTEDNDTPEGPEPSIPSICTLTCPIDKQRVTASPGICFCAVPLKVEYRLKSPGFSDYPPYRDDFNVYLSSVLSLELYQLSVFSIAWEKGPRLKMHLNLFPNRADIIFNESEIKRIKGLFTSWKIRNSDIFGPYELLVFGRDADIKSNLGLSKGALAGIILGVIAGAVTSTALVSIFIARRYMKNYYRVMSKKHQLSKRISIKVDGVKGFTFEEMALATYNFDSSTQVGQGGYGKVYKGVLSDGSFVAIKRAQEGSFQGDKEFYNEIELLSRVHHRNLVSLIGCCDEEGEQMLVYEFMSGGTLRDHLSAKSKAPLSFAMRLRIATDSAKGILYLHTEADPPIFHRDVKSSNILIGPRFRGKVADFGLSRLAPVPDIEGKTPGHVSTIVKGTPGYLDPEYFLTYKLTDKSDVYSLGVVFLEILTGRLPIQNGKNIVREVTGEYNSGTIFSIIDEKMGSYPSKCIQKFVTLALQCCQEDTDARPSMAQIVKELDNILYMMPESDISIAVSTDHGIDDSEVSMTITTTTPPSSSSVSVNNMNWDLNVSSEYISSSDLVSGVVPTIAPR
ncbi:probable LRR receptor-like serine/threonine-protein kinase At1g06840 isoform X2 [Papaver somniferum]|uniref:probable LRR receptor-like serine/threonine-protein kinase At1g06840 isoform X2 n=1 Tax=Papaver somniferum TaxID=3469 RepID=UPI000E700E95|nr:probable LRR receptor-like serine/threonine-protein kinase At1g06840 isoform X2 [Papaver somniferum]